MYACMKYYVTVCWVLYLVYFVYRYFYSEHAITSLNTLIIFRQKVGFKINILLDLYTENHDVEIIYKCAFLLMQ